MEDGIVSVAWVRTVCWGQHLAAVRAAELALAPAVRAVRVRVVVDRDLRPVLNLHACRVLGNRGLDRRWLAIPWLNAAHQLPLLRGLRGVAGTCGEADAGVLRLLHGLVDGGRHSRRHQRPRRGAAASGADDVSGYARPLRAGRQLHNRRRDTDALRVVEHVVGAALHVRRARVVVVDRRDGNARARSCPYYAATQTQRQALCTPSTPSKHPHSACSPSDSCADTCACDFIERLAALASSPTYLDLVRSFRVSHRGRRQRRFRRG